MVIPSISQPLQLITLNKAAWDEWAHMYRYVSNISHVFDVYDQLFLVKNFRHYLQDNYTLVYELLNRLELYQMHTKDITTQCCYHEKLSVAIFLVRLNPLISFEIQGSIPNEAHL